MSAALKIYNRLPSSSRSVVASLHGYYLAWWRYDTVTESRVKEALEREQWTVKEWDEWRQKRLSSVLHRAATRVPYYRDLWAKRRRDGDRSSYELLENWPILEKSTLRERAIDFVADDCNRRWMYRSHTSGTTGTALDLWMTGETVKHWYALFEARWRQWYGVSRKDRWAILGGQLVTPVQRTSPPFWVWNSGLNQLYMSSYHLSPNVTHHYLDALVKYRVKYLWAYSSAAFALAREVRDAGIRDLNLECVITNAEPLFEHQRTSIEMAFRCPVWETYGMAEMVAAASECEFGSRHLWPDAGVVEFAGVPLESGAAELICTGLVNADMPLIRYRVGDLAGTSQKVCGCGRNMPVIDALEGRTDDVLFTREGRRVGRLDPVFKGNLPINEAQIIQNSLDEVLVRFVPSKDFDRSALSLVSKRIRERMGDVSVSFEPVEVIPRSHNGKFRAVLCNIPKSELGPLI